jgi:hypothetical protein
MLPLTQKIRDRLKTHKACTIFEKDLSQVWPYSHKQREQRYKLIKQYAAQHGWSATILDPGIRVTFRKLPQPEDSQAQRAA